MKKVIFLIIGILFGIVMTKSEVISWFRIQEMFRFQSFHMYGVIAVAVAMGAIIQASVKRFKLKSFFGADIEIADKPKTYVASIIGGSIFGLGWAMTGACPGPLYTLLGHGFLSVLLIIIAAIFGAYLYGIMRSKLPH